MNGEPQFPYETLTIRSLSRSHNVPKSDFLEIINRCEQRKMKRSSEVLEFFKVRPCGQMAGALNPISCHTLSNLIISACSPIGNKNKGIHMRYRCKRYYRDWFKEVE